MKKLLVVMAAVCLVSAFAFANEEKVEAEKHEVHAKHKKAKKAEGHEGHDQEEKAKTE